MKNSKVLAKQLEVQLEKVSLLKVLLPLNFQLSIQKKWIIVDKKTNRNGGRVFFNIYPIQNARKWI